MNQISLEKQFWGKTSTIGDKIFNKVNMKS